jgi:hypothetical protein
MEIMQRVLSIDLNSVIQYFQNLFIFNYIAVYYSLLTFKKMTCHKATKPQSPTKIKLLASNLFVNLEIPGDFVAMDLSGMTVRN